jgi:hypothetical protein
LRKFGYRQVLIANTVMLGVMLMLFSLIDVGTPGWLIASMAFALRILHLDPIHQHEHAGIRRRERRAGERRQHHRQHGAAMAVSFGVASASLTAAVFIPGSHAGPRRRR